MGREAGEGWGQPSQGHNGCGLCPKGSRKPQDGGEVRIRWQLFGRRKGQESKQWSERRRMAVTCSGRHVTGSEWVKMEATDLSEHLAEG